MPSETAAKVSCRAGYQNGGCHGRLLDGQRYAEAWVQLSAFELLSGHVGPLPAGFHV